MIHILLHVSVLCRMTLLGVAGIYGMIYCFRMASYLRHACCGRQTEDAEHESL